ncbi:MAG: hypothetical protein RIR62_1281 [Pseudomonadota bacterium]
MATAGEDATPQVASAIAEDVSGGPAALPPPSDAPDAPAAPPRRRRRRMRTGLFSLLLVTVLFAGAGLAVLALSGAALRLPVWAVVQIEDRLNRQVGALVPDGAVALGAVVLRLDRDRVPVLAMEDLRLLHKGGRGTLLRLPEAQLALDGQSLIAGEIRPASLRLIGASIALARRADGTLDIGLAGGGIRIDSLPALFSLIDTAFATPALSQLDYVEAEALSLTIDDRLTARRWSIGDGRLLVENRPDAVAAQLGLSLVAGGAAPAQATLTAVLPKGSQTARLTATVDGVAARDIALQAVPLAPLAVLDAPISGSLAATLEGRGVTEFDARLSVGAGALRPTEGALPIAFNSAFMEIRYDPAAGKVRMTALEVDSPSLRLKARGHSYLARRDGAILTGPLGAERPAAFLTQISVTEAKIDPEGLFETPVRFSAGALDLRLTLDPFKVEIGQLALVDEGLRLGLRGTIGADRAGWRAALDVGVDRLEHGKLIALWPVRLVPKTREWLARNVLEGTLSDVRAALRIDPGKEARLSLSYDFADADVRFLPTLPPITDGDGYATVEGQTYTMVLSEGTVTPPVGGRIDMAGTVFSVLDFTRRPAQAEVTLRTDSTLTAALSILDEPPFRFLTKAGRPVDLGEGRARMEAILRFPLKPRLMPGDVGYAVAGRISGFISDRVVAGKEVRAEALTLSANPRGMTIAGQGVLGQMPFDVVYAQPFGPDAGPATVEGTVTLSPETLREFGLALPEAMLSGEGSGQITLRLPKGAPAELALVSDLNRMALSIPGTGWSKPAAARGRLDLAATLTRPARITRLDISAEGMAAEGAVELAEGGALAEARFSRVTLGDWFRGSVSIAGRGAGRPVAVTVTGGEIDLRRLPDDMGGGRGGGGADIPLDVRLDRLRVTETLSVGGFEGRFTPLGGFNGSFTGLVNDIAPVTGTVVPAANGSALRIRSADAGAVLAAAGVFASARGGDLDLRLTPRGDRGHYDGVALISRVRVVDAPVLAELLNAVSVVGLLDQLSGEGLVFNDVVGEFLLTPAAVEIRRGSAIGLSLGISMAGVYATQSRQLALQGVVSPLYLVNGIGSAITQRGEGVFGFNYELRGTASRPVVSVNPLSILTPGRLREIFRRPPPRLGTTDESAG